MVHLQAARRNKKKDKDFINDGSSDEGSKRRQRRRDREILEEDARKFKGKSEFLFSLCL